MTEAVERLVNLALFLAAVRGPKSAEQIRAEVAGYPRGQDETAFIRMFERDKDELRAMGIAIEATPEGAYRLDGEQTFVSALDLTSDEETVLRVTATVFAADPSFPFAHDLRYALAKIAGTAEADVPAVARLVDESPGAQGAAVSVLTAASMARKRVTFDYTNAQGVSASHEVEPFGVFLHSARWYLVGRDVALDEVRVYAVARMGKPAPNASRPKAPDFERPEGFDVGSYIGLPFQYGAGEAFEAVVRFSPASSWRTRAITGGRGALHTDGDGLVWHVAARDVERLARWVSANGPGITIVSPPEATNMLRAGLEKAAVRHA